MILGIDASNIRAGGGITHLVELLAAADPTEYGFDSVVIWAPISTLSLLEERSWLIKRSDPYLEQHFIYRTWWQYNHLDRVAQGCGCDLLFIPGGSFVTGFCPVVTMSQNLLPFEWRELLRYGISRATLRLIILRWMQSRSYRRAAGTIFLTRYARDVVLNTTGPLGGKTAIIPHGISQRFFHQPRGHRPVVEFGKDSPVRLVYVSIINVYKHQWNVAEAVGKLRNEGFPVVLDLIGPANPVALRRLMSVMRRIDPGGNILRYHGAVPHDELHSYYSMADIFVFASSCENMPNILLEGMASGLPIACSKNGPMPEILGKGGVYFDPESPASISMAIRSLLQSPGLRSEKAHIAYERAQNYSWKKCANETFEFLSNVLD